MYIYMAEGAKATLSMMICRLLLPMHRMMTYIPHACNVVETLGLVDVAQPVVRVSTKTLHSQCILWPCLMSVVAMHHHDCTSLIMGPHAATPLEVGVFGVEIGHLLAHQLRVLVLQLLDSSHLVLDVLHQHLVLGSQNARLVEVLQGPEVGQHLRLCLHVLPKRLVFLLYPSLQDRRRGSWWNLLKRQAKGRHVLCGGTYIQYGVQVHSRRVPSQKDLEPASPGCGSYSFTHVCSADVCVYLLLSSSHFHRHSIKIVKWVQSSLGLP